MAKIALQPRGIRVMSARTHSKPLEDDGAPLAPLDISAGEILKGTLVPLKLAASPSDIHGLVKYRAVRQLALTRGETDSIPDHQEMAGRLAIHSGHVHWGLKLFLFGRWALLFVVIAFTLFIVPTACADPTSAPGYARRRIRRGHWWAWPARQQDRRNDLELPVQSPCSSWATPASTYASLQFLRARSRGRVWLGAELAGHRTQATFREPLLPTRWHPHCLRRAAHGITRHAN